MFIPLHDDNPLESIPAQYVTWALIGINVAVFFLFQGAMTGELGLAAVERLALFPITIFHIDRPPDITLVPDGATLITYAFLHADIWHLVGNMVFLWVFGDNVEDAMGHLRFLVFYLLCAVGGGLLHTLVMPESNVPLIGASGAVAGIVAAYLMLHPRVQIWILALGRIPLRLSAFWVLGFWVGLQVFNAFLGGDAAVAWWAHIGGILTGAVLIVFLRRRGVALFDRGLA